MIPGGTNLTAIAKLSPHDTLSRDLEVASWVDHDGIFATELHSTIKEAV